MSQDNQIDVTELPKNQLQKSPTYLKYADECGRCTKCGEMSELLCPCCDATMDFEGGLVTADSIWNAIEQELSEQAEAAYYDSLEDNGDDL